MCERKKLVILKVFPNTFLLYNTGFKNTHTCYQREVVARFLVCYHVLTKNTLP